MGVVWRAVLCVHCVLSLLPRLMLLPATSHPRSRASAGPGETFAAIVFDPLVVTVQLVDPSLFAPDVRVELWTNLAHALMPQAELSPDALESKTMMSLHADAEGCVARVSCWACGLRSTRASEEFRGDPFRGGTAAVADGRRSRCVEPHPCVAPHSVSVAGGAWLGAVRGHGARRHAFLN